MAGSSYVDMPLSQVLYRYVWPFWLFRDATRGDRYARAAAYRHNRDMRIHLPGYLLRLLGVGALTLALASCFGSLAMAHSAVGIFAVLAAGGGIAFACCVCMLFLTSYIYVYLSRHEH
ncbi:MAG TPA: hypothetical protein VJQ52_04800 [Steroidobacteraceae bacterium]|nr:hypothetical protein [Steroidobacteraceae bacterium]